MARNPREFSRRFADQASTLSDRRGAAAASQLAQGNATSAAGQLIAIYDDAELSLSANVSASDARLDDALVQRVLRSLPVQTTG